MYETHTAKLEWPKICTDKEDLHPLAKKTVLYIYMKFSLLSQNRLKYGLVTSLIPKYEKGNIKG